MEIDSIDMRNYRCVEKQDGAYIVAVMVEHFRHFKSFG